MICGSKLPLRSRGVSTRTGPCSVTSVFAVEPLTRVARAARRLLVLEAEMLGQLRRHRPFHQPFCQLREHTARADDLLLAARACEQLVDHLVRETMTNLLRQQLDLRQRRTDA